MSKRATTSEVSKRFAYQGVNESQLELAPRGETEREGALTVGDRNQTASSQYRVLSRPSGLVDRSQISNADSPSTNFKRPGMTYARSR